MAPILALGISAVVALAAWRAGALSGDGGIAAVLVGTPILYGCGWPGAAMLAVFFVGSTLVGRVSVARGRSADPAAERRSARQVLANGAAAAAGALLEHRSPGLGLWFVAGALSAAAADTWATSIGGFSVTDPRHLISGRRVPRGTSGGVSAVGTFGALIGAATVAVAGWLGAGGMRFFAAATAVGFVGMLLDSLLGATLQGRFECAQCGVATERRTHGCGTPTRLAGGIAWMDNDAVNALSTTAAGLAAAMLWYAWAR